MDGAFLGSLCGFFFLRGLVGVDVSSLKESERDIYIYPSLETDR